MSVADAASNHEAPQTHDLPDRPRIEGNNLIIPIGDLRHTDVLHKALDNQPAFAPPPRSAFPFEAQDGHLYERYVRDLARERALVAIAEVTAAALLDVARVVPLGCAIPTLDAQGLVQIIASRHGSPSDFPQWDPPKPPQNVDKAKIPGGHLKLHRIAERDGGWNCFHCGIGLIDLCTDDDIAYDHQGRRYVKPGSLRELATVDHQVPQSLNGSHQVRNLVLSCRSCNTSRGARA